MKIEELFTECPLYPLEEIIEGMLEKFDWMYEYYFETRYKRGRLDMEFIEKRLCELYDVDRNKALDIWRRHCPYASDTKVPSFLLEHEVKRDG